MRILYLDRLVLVQLASKFKFCRFYLYENADEVCMFCLWIFIPWAFVFYCICNICSFFSRWTDSWGNDIFILNLTKTECIVGGLFKNRVKFVSANSFVCGSYFSFGTFLNRFPLYIIRREESVFPYFTLFSVNFFWRTAREQMKEKYLIVRTHFPWGKLPRKEQKKGKLSTVAANSSQMSLPWCVIFHRERSTKTDLE